jgi:hypothetical protein
VSPSFIKFGIKNHVYGKGGESEVAEYLKHSELETVLETNKEVTAEEKSNETELANLYKHANEV